MRWQKSGSFGFAKGRLCVSGQNQMCHLCGWLKLFLKKCGGGKNKKHRVGNECRLTRCPFVKSSLCLWSPVKMVYFFLVFSPLFDVCTVVLPLAITFPRYTQVGVNKLIFSVVTFFGKYKTVFILALCPTCL